MLGVPQVTLNCCTVLAALERVGVVDYASMTESLPSSGFMT